MFYQLKTIANLQNAKIRFNTRLESLLMFLRWYEKQGHVVNFRVTSEKTLILIDGKVIVVCGKS